MSVSPRAPEGRGESAAQAGLVVRLAGGLSELSTGERAALRRLDPAAASAAAMAVLVRALVRAGADIEEWLDPDLRRWTLLLHLMALLAGAGDRPQSPHLRGVQFGAVLHDERYSEARFLRLMEARGAILNDLLGRAARFLAARGVSALDFVAVAPLVLDPDGYRAERARLRFAREFFAAQARSEAAATPAGDGG